MRTTTDILKLISAILISQLAGVIGSAFTFRAIPTWYAGLEKPTFSPPNWIFGPVWTMLYTLMGIAAWLVWRKGFADRSVRIALILFLIQLALNALWSVIFFGLRSPTWAFAEIVVLWIAIVMTTIYFFKISRAAGALMIPYIAWVSFAAALNLYVARLNR